MQDDVVDRHEQDRRREHLRDQERHQRGPVAGEAVAGERVRRRRREEDADHRREERDHDRVPHPRQEDVVVVREDVRVVRDLPVVRQDRERRRADDLLLALERADQDPEDGEDRDHAREDQEPVQEQRHVPLAPPPAPALRPVRPTPRTRAPLIGPGALSSRLLTTTSPRPTARRASGRSSRRRAASRG